MTAFRMVTAAVLLAAVTATSGCAAPENRAIPPPSTTPPTPGVRPTQTPAGFSRPDAPSTWATNLDAPWSVVPVGQGALVSERDSGTIVEVLPDGSAREAGVVPGVVSGGEAGLHGLAVWEDAGSRWLYAYHGAADDNRVVRMPLRGATGSLSLGGAEAVLTGIPRAETHNGGRIAFGPDGDLFVATGDANMRDAAQDTSSLAGKILRLTPTGEAAEGNPFDSRVYSLGHRNVQGLAWTGDGTMWASEFGQNTWDELNRIEPGANYGWPVVEGVADRPEFVDPVRQWRPAEASPSGIAAVGSTVFVAALRGSRLWAVDVQDGTVVGEPEALWVDEQGRLRDVAVGPEDELWVLTNNTDGRGDPGERDDILLRSTLMPRS